MSSLSFTKLFSSITDSSVWQESDGTRLVWITMLSMADPLGRIHAAIPGLAHRARVSLPETEKALELFMAPDAYSRSEDHDGRRIERIQGGWRLLNYAAYREMRDDEARKEQNRTAQKNYRKKVSKIVSKIADSKQTSADVSRVSQSKPPSAQEEVEGEVEEESTKNKQLPSRDKREGDSRHVPFRDEVERYMTAKGVLFAWDGGAAKQLDLILKSVPQLDLTTFQRWLMHRARSPGVTHGEHPKAWLPKILKYQEGKLNEFGKTGEVNGTRNATVEKQQISHSSIAAARERRLGGQIVPPDGPGAGFLPEPDIATGDAGCVDEGMGGDGCGDGPGEVRGRIVEGVTDGKLHA